MSRKYQVQTGDVLTKIAQPYGFAGPGSSQDGFAEVQVCVNGYLEAAPAA
jgi:hypothetical protein